MNSEPMREFTCTVYAQVASKANQRRLVKFGGKPRFIKSEKALALVKAIEEQVPVQAKMLEGDLEVYVKIYYPSRRQDLDPSAIFDALQGRFYKNDRQIKRYTAEWGLDAGTPRFELRVWTMESVCSPSS